MYVDYLVTRWVNQEMLEEMWDIVASHYPEIYK
jgi:hypothetical protein